MNSGKLGPKLLTFSKTFNLDFFILPGAWFHQHYYVIVQTGEKSLKNTITIKVTNRRKTKLSNTLETKS